MLKFAILGALGAILAGCAVPVTQVGGPDGRPAYVLKCSGLGRDRQDCMMKAGEVCPQGYRLVDDSSQVNGAIISNGIVGIAREDYLTISCRS